jgi:hypothetical protein
MHAGLDGGDLVIAGAQGANQVECVRGMFPGDSLLGAERRLGDFFARRLAGDAAEVQLLDGRGVAVRKKAPTL